MSATRTRSLLSIQPASDGGGSETALIRMLHQLGREGWDCHVAVPSPPRLADEYAAAGATVHVVAMATRRVTTSGGLGRWWRYGRDWPGSVLRLARLARRCGADVVHSNSLHCWYGWAVAALVRRPHVWHAREIVTQSGAALRLERVLAADVATRVVAISAAVAAQLDPANVEVIGDEPDPEVWSPSLAGRFRPRLGLADEAVVVGSVARIDTWKGFDVLIDAVPAIRAAVPGVVVVVAGVPVDGKEAYAAELAARAAALGGIHWLGHRRDIPELMADLDVFVQVSTTPEPFGLVDAEALASGVPIVTGDEGGPVEILASAEPGAGIGVPARDPAAVLAAAVVGLLAGTPSSAARRQARPRLRRAPDGRFAAVFAAVASERSSGRR